MCVFTPKKAHNCAHRAHLHTSPLCVCLCVCVPNPRYGDDNPRYEGAVVRREVALTTAPPTPSRGTYFRKEAPSRGAYSVPATRSIISLNSLNSLISLFSLINSLSQQCTPCECVKMLMVVNASATRKPATRFIYKINNLYI